MRADHTVTFAFAKLGLVGAEEQRSSGALHVVDIGIPDKLARERGVKAELLEEAVLAPLRARSVTEHKGTHGHVLVVAGSRGKTGAALLCGTAVAARRRAACAPSPCRADAAALVEGRVPELMIEPVARRRSRRRCSPARSARRGRPGHRAATTPRWLASARSATRELPLVVDADALNAIAADRRRSCRGAARRRC